ncbi:PrsW family intramembrane metalloprotease [Corynebacterium sp. TAE3-ERU16]|uniref:PrsW family intramembrane metalloprotease n=1 Tax=Corynebacterium sp. TAE3-ERU16 TaxID=2849493 RepID=UPI001C4670AD|nr:PrsW family intramembrane metalloprotease [Corynebacterium sp. TAE3-ERU16]
MNRFLRGSLWVLDGIGLLVGGGLALVVALFAGLATDGELPSMGVMGLSALLAVVELSVVLLVVRSSPLWPRAGAGYVVAALLWGGAVSPLLAFPLSSTSLDLPGRLGLDHFEASWGGAYPEETVKTLGVLIILFSFRRLTRPWHGLVTGILVGLGFEVVENVGYAVIGAVYDPVSDVKGMLWIWGVRVAAGPLLHVLFTGMAGWGLGVAVFTAHRSRLWRLGTGLLWVSVAFAAHFCWNIMYDDTRAAMVSMGAVALVIYPLFIWLFIRGWRAARRDAGYVLLDRPVMSLRELEQGGFVVRGAVGAGPVDRGQPRM